MYAINEQIKKRIVNEMALLSGMNAGKQLLYVNKISSAAAMLVKDDAVEITVPEKHVLGDLVVVRVTDKSVNTNPLELGNGRLATVNCNDLIVGVLGKRCALKGFTGELPENIGKGDILNILNLGGIVGKATGKFQSLHSPIEAEYIGGVTRDGKILNLSQIALPEVSKDFNIDIPLVMVAGTCMQAGKTKAAAELVKSFTRAGYRVGAAKLTGIACLRDTLLMEDFGAMATMSFLNCGYPSTIDVKDVAPLTKSIISRLVDAGSELIVVELGDGIMGYYNVQSIFDDPRIMSWTSAIVVCANDFAGAWGAKEYLGRKGHKVDLIAGPATDSQMAVEFIENSLGISAANAINGSQKFFKIIDEKVEKWKSSAEK
ncbi:MAG: hypothetical protein HQK54_17980 [Oligoflexales bacterium]|nr:hypothetical protein [Oligoflexales bacterium]